MFPASLQSFLNKFKKQAADDRSGRSDRFAEDSGAIVPQWESNRTSNPLDPMAPGQGVQEFIQKTDQGTAGMPGAAAQTDPFQYINSPLINPDKTKESPGQPSSQEVQNREHSMKEMFEASVLERLLEEGSVDPTQALKEPIPRWVESLNDLGKTILVMEANFETFQELMGQSEAENTLQNLKKLFNIFGKTILQLMQNIPHETQEALFAGSEQEREINI